MTQDIKKQIAIHECGHAMIAKLFEKEFTLKAIFLMDPVLNVTPNEPVESWGDETKQKSILIGLGGLCAENIYIKSKKEIIENLGNYLNYNLNLDYSGSIDDFGMINQLLPFDVTTAKGKDYFSNSLKLAFEYLIKDKVWETLEKLSQKLLLSINGRIEKEELKLFFEESGFDDYLEKTNKQ